MASNFASRPSFSLRLLYLFVVYAPRNPCDELVTCTEATESIHHVSREKYAKNDSSIKKITSSLPFLVSHTLNPGQSLLICPQSLQWWHLGPLFDDSCLTPSFLGCL
jgi:hypothetical protein